MLDERQDGNLRLYSFVKNLQFCPLYSSWKLLFLISSTFRSGQVLKDSYILALETEDV